jgi:pimeloyl-ACP methyl ester carboxylesterase
LAAPLHASSCSLLMDVPDPRYVKTEDGAYVAYQVVGDGPVDIAWQFDFYGNIDLTWDGPFARAWFEGLAAFGRLILHDRRATGLSSRDVPAPNLETQAADLRAVLDAGGSERVVLGAWFESLAPCVLLAATDPGRVGALAWANPAPRTIWAPGLPVGLGSRGGGAGASRARALGDDRAWTGRGRAIRR